MNALITLILMAIFSSSLASSTVIVSNSTANINTEARHLSQAAPELNTKVLKLALTAYQKALHSGVAKKQILTVIDYSLPSSKQRLWVFDVRKEKLLYHMHVAHGKNSGQTIATHFSNQVESKETSLGAFVTKNTYIGAHGYSLNLQGLEKGFNDHAYERRVVVHGAPYVEPGYIKSVGHAGRSWGCPAIAASLAKPLINTIKDGSVIFAYYPDKKYLTTSHYI
ncbi:MAG: murein L,D-transpeptidase catalytic domain family protein [Legionella sp.]|nr:murein L,D-transpeptidase catalytic domain family protein [Legionella sp.]